MSQNHYLRRIHKVLLYSALTVIAVWGSVIHAQEKSTCETPFNFFADGNWEVNKNINVTNGTTVATLNGYTRTTVIISEHDTNAQFEAITRLTGQNYDYTQNAQPLKNNPGLGLRVSWNSFAATPQVTTPVNQPAGTIINSFNFSVLLLANLTQSTNYTIDSKYKFELVVLDIKTYSGGLTNLLMDGDVNTILRLFNVLEGNTALFCNTSYASQILQGSLSLPELPKPNLPTCQFNLAELNQSVALGTSSSDSVASITDNRSVGARGEKQFSLSATRCGVNTYFNLYFTDANRPGSGSNYLTQTSGSVGLGKLGVRIFHAGEITPILFGPTPTGSTTPTRAPIMYGPAGADQTFIVPFTAQYVRMAGILPAQVPQGLVSAQTIVTVTYP